MITLTDGEVVRNEEGARLPVVLGRAVAAGLAVLQGVVDGVHDGGVLVSDVHSEIVDNQ